MVPLSSIFFLNLIHSKKTLYPTIYITIKKIKTADWVERNRKKVSDTKKKKESKKNKKMVSIVWHTSALI